MSCGCGKRGDPALAGTTLRQSASFAEISAGIYDTTSAPGCTEPYHGIYKSATVYVLDINGPREEFFRRGERNTAVRKARIERLTLDHVAATNLCHETMLSLLGS